MSAYKVKILRLGVFVRRHPYLFALIGFLSGVGSFLLVDRQEGMASAIAALMLASWVLLLLERPIRRLVGRWSGIDVPAPLVHFTTQLVHQESFFFVLPFFLITTTWTSTQALFTVAIAAAAVVSIWDPVYHGRLTRRRWLYLAYHATAIFVTLLTALPIIFHLSTPQTYATATVLTVIFAVPSLTHGFTARGLAGAVGLVALTLALGATAWFGRAIVPPATFWLTDMAITGDMDEDMRRANGTKDVLCPEELDGGRVYAFSGVRAPRGLNEAVHHEWSHEGHLYDRVDVQVFGGREQGYRIWTYKENFPGEPNGHWRVRVRTESGQLIGQINFDIDC